MQKDELGRRGDLGGRGEVCLVGDIDCGGEGEDGGSDDQKVEDLPRICEEGLPPKHQHAGMQISHGVSCRISVRKITEFREWPSFADLTGS